MAGTSNFLFEGRKTIYSMLVIGDREAGLGKVPARNESPGPQLYPAAVVDVMESITLAPGRGLCSVCLGLRQNKHRFTCRRGGESRWGLIGQRCPMGSSHGGCCGRRGGEGSAGRRLVVPLIDQDTSGERLLRRWWKLWFCAILYLLQGLRFGAFGVGILRGPQLETVTIFGPYA